VKRKATPVRNGIWEMPDRHDDAHAVPDEALLWPGFRFACAPELLKNESRCRCKTRAKREGQRDGRLNPEKSWKPDEGYRHLSRFNCPPKAYVVKI
jgi:hypothetical protein